MKIKVYENRQVEIIKQSNTQNENEAEIIELEVPEIYKEWNKKIVFILPIKTNNIVWDLFDNEDKYILRKNVTQYPTVQFYIWLTHETKDFRSVTTSLYFNTNKDASGQITPEEIGAVNTILAELDTALDEVDNIDIDVNKSGTATTVELTKKDGTQKTVQINDGQDGKTPVLSFEIVDGNLIMTEEE